jgi:hypothetical protein
MQRVTLEGAAERPGSTCAGSLGRGSEAPGKTLTIGVGTTRNIPWNEWKRAKPAWNEPQAELKLWSTSSEMRPHWYVGASTPNEWQRQKRRLEGGRKHSPRYKFISTGTTGHSHEEECSELSHTLHVKIKSDCTINLNSRANTIRKSHG